MEFNCKYTIFFSQNVEALLHYSKLFNEFLPSLENVQDLLKYFPVDRKSKVETKLNNVIEGLTKSQDKMQEIIEVINSAQITKNWLTLVCINRIAGDTSTIFLRPVLLKNAREFLHFYARKNMIS